MRRAVISISALAFAVTTAAGALAAASPPTKLGGARVSVTECHPSDDVAERSASFTGHMRAIPGTKRMAMHFTLLERLRGVSGFKPVSLPDLKPWRRSKQGARAFIYTQRVTALRDGGSYRMRVQFRWYGPHHTLLRTSVARSRACRQPAPLPNLSISSISAMSTDRSTGERTYAVTLANDGAGEARDVAVDLKVDGTVAGTATVDLLPAAESVVVQMQGPACSFAVRAVADPDKLIRETDDSDNALTVPCAQAIA